MRALAEFSETLREVAKDGGLGKIERELQRGEKDGGFTGFFRGFCGLAGPAEFHLGMARGGEFRKKQADDDSGGKPREWVARDIGLDAREDREIIAESAEVRAHPGSSVGEIGRQGVSFRV